MKIHINCPSCESDIKISMQNSEETGDINCPYCESIIHIGDDTQQPEEEQIDLGFDPAQLLMRGIQSVTPAITNWEAPTVEELNDSLEERYNIISILGRGGMGAVYKATDTRLSRSVAIKILPIELGENEEAVSRFEREAKALAALDHPNIINIHDYGQTDEGHIYFVMEFIEGKDLQQLRKSGDIDLSSALDIVSQVCAALDFAHGKGIIHRDIKPANVLVGNDGRVKVADFGLAKTLTTQSRQQVDPTITASGTAMGTPDYMAPEQKEGQRVDHRADIYALGVMLYDLLTGAPPRGAWSAPSQRLEIDIRLDQIIIKSLQEDPAERYQSVDDVKSDIDSVKASTGGEPIPVGAAVEPLPSTMRRPSGIARARTAPNNQTTRVFDSSDHTQAQAEHTSSMDAIVQTTKSTNKTMLLLGTFAILTIGAIAIYVGAFKKDGDTYNTVNNTTYQEIQNNYFSQIIVNGTTTKKDLEMVQGIKPYGTLFIGISKELLTLTEAQDLAKRTGSTILDYTTSQPNKPAPLNLWLKSSFTLKQKAWVKIHSQHQIINDEATLSVAEIEEKHHVLLAWQGPKEQMLNAQIDENNTPDEAKLMTADNTIKTKQQRVLAKLLAQGLKISNERPPFNENGWMTLFDGKTLYCAELVSIGKDWDASFSEGVLTITNLDIRFSPTFENLTATAVLHKRSGQETSLLIAKNPKDYAGFYYVRRNHMGFGRATREHGWRGSTSFTPNQPNVTFFEFKYSYAAGKHSLWLDGIFTKSLEKQLIEGPKHLYVRSEGYKGNPGVIMIKNISVSKTVTQPKQTEHPDSLKKGIPTDAVEFNGHYYKFYPSKKNWEKAQKECVARGGHLAIANSLAEYHQLSLLAKKEHVWIGADNKKDGMRWLWNDGREIAQSFWAWQCPTDPNHSNYVILYKGFLQSSRISHGYLGGYLCEWSDNTLARQEASSTQKNSELVARNIPDDAVEFLGNRYMIYNSHENWYMALLQCKKLGGSLVTINSQRELKFLTDYIKEKGYERNEIWLGASNLYKNNQWKWADQTPYSLSNLTEADVPHRYLIIQQGRLIAKASQSHYGKIYICKWVGDDKTVTGNTDGDENPSANTLATPTIHTLTNKKGKTMRVEILSTTNTHVKVRRLKDKKEFNLKLNTLSKKDQDFIKKWLQQKQPTTPSKKN